MQTSHLSEFISWGDLVVKLPFKNVIFKKTGNDYSLKTKQNTANYAQTMNRINTYRRL